MFNWLEFYEGWSFSKANSNKTNMTLANLYFEEECNEKKKKTLIKRYMA